MQPKVSWVQIQILPQLTLLPLAHLNHFTQLCTPNPIALTYYYIIDLFTTATLYVSHFLLRMGPPGS